MTDIEINRKLHELALNGDSNKIRHEIALQATDTERPADFLREMKDNQGLKYEPLTMFFVNCAEDIIATLEGASETLDIKLTLKNWTIELGYLAYQITLKEMMDEYGM